MDIDVMLAVVLAANGLGLLYLATRVFKWIFGTTAEPIDRSKISVTRPVTEVTHGDVSASAPASGSAAVEAGRDGRSRWLRAS